MAERFRLLDKEVAVARRLTKRGYPDANQLGIATSTVINQSRLTFSGAPGFVGALWLTVMTQASAVQVDLLTTSFVGPAVTLDSVPGEAWFDNVVGRRHSILNIMFFTDPAEASFVELRVAHGGGGNVDVPASQSAVFVLSFPTEPGGGPIVTAG